MTDLLVAAIVFAGAHVTLASTSLRAMLVEAVGDRGFALLFSTVALVTLVWLILSFRAAPVVPIWQPGPLARSLPLVVMPAALLLIVGSLMGPNPTAVGQRPDPDAAEPVRGILRVTRHPFLWGVGAWALVHVLANGDTAALLFFGTFAVLALGGTLLVDAKRTRENPPGWGVFVQRSSNLPFLAILQRRQRFHFSEIGWPPVVLTLLCAVALIVLHPVLFGVRAIP